MLRGRTTVSFFADDVVAAQGWYTELLGIEPYFMREIAGAPAYVERHAERAVSRGDRARAVLPVDRRPARKGEPVPADHATQPAQPVERGEPSARCEHDRAGA
jgi:hypothetical protein